MERNPSPWGWVSIVSMICGGVIAMMLADRFMPTFPFVELLVLTLVVLGSIGGLLAGRLFETRQR